MPHPEIRYRCPVKVFHGNRLKCTLAAYLEFCDSCLLPSCDDYQILDGKKFGFPLRIFSSWFSQSSKEADHTFWIIHSSWCFSSFSMTDIRVLVPKVRR